MEAEPFPDRAGQRCKAAGDQGGIGSVAPHGGNKRLGARGHFDFGQKTVQQAGRMPYQHRDPFLQCCLEIKLAPHGPRSDRRDLVADPGIAGEIVEGFGRDDR